jgi:hypothetical protein
MDRFTENPKAKAIPIDLKRLAPAATRAALMARIFFVLLIASLLV